MYGNKKKYLQITILVFVGVGKGSMPYFLRYMYKVFRYSHFLFSSTVLHSMRLGIDVNRHKVRKFFFFEISNLVLMLYLQNIWYSAPVEGD